MSTIFLDGFDKYGTPNGSQTTSGTIPSLLTQEWTTLNNNGGYIVAGLSATGYALYMPNYFNNMTKTIVTNRIIGGCRINPTGTNNGPAINFQDTGNLQCQIFINSAGLIVMYGNGNNTTLATSSVTVPTNSTHYIEWDITINSSTGSFQVWLDGVSAVSGTGVRTTSTSNNSINQFQIQGPCIYDDLYLFNSSGTTNNAVLLTNPRIETTFPTADVQTQFTNTADILGSYFWDGNTSNYNNNVCIRSYSPKVNETINSIGTIFNSTSSSSNLKGVIYTNSGTSPTTLLSDGTVVTGVTTGVPVVLPLVTPQTLVAGTKYWIGFINDSNGIANYRSDSNNLGLYMNITWPTTPTTASSYGSCNSPTIWGNCTGPTSNWSIMASNPPNGDLAYAASSTVGNEDLYSFNALSSTPSAIYAVGVKASCRKTDTGVRTMNVQTKSGTVDSTGSVAGFSPATTYAYMDSYYDVDPNTSAAWTLAALNAASSGVKIAS